MAFVASNLSYMKTIFRYLTLFLIFLLPGCAKKRHEKRIYGQASSIKNTQVYTLKAEGIECKLCATLSVKALESVPGIVKAEFICLDKDFKNYFIKLYLKNSTRNPNIKNLKTALKKEGFVLTSISGNFVGEYSKDFDKFKFTQSNEEFKIFATLPSELKKKISNNAQTNLNAELRLDEKSGEYKIRTTYL